MRISENSGTSGPSARSTNQSRSMTSTRTRSPPNESCLRWNPIRVTVPAKDWWKLHLHPAPEPHTERMLSTLSLCARRSCGSVKGQLAPSSFYCPISMELMSDPVVLATGHTYERVCIERWLQQGNRTCPVTGMRLRHLEMTPNFALRVAVQVRPPGPLPGRKWHPMIR